MKKVLAVSLAVFCFLFQCLEVTTLNATATQETEDYDEPAVFSFEEVTAEPGELFTITVSLLNNPGLCGFKFYVQFEDTFEFVDAKALTVGSGLGVIPDGAQFDRTPVSENGDGTNMVGVVSLNWEGDYYDSGNLCQMTFRAPQEISGDVYFNTSIDNDNTFSDEVGDINSVSTGVIIHFGNSEHTHEFGDWVVTVEPTCLDEGEKTATCLICGETVVESIPSLGHDEGNWETVKEATCLESGQRQRKCSRCSALLEEEELPKTEHAFGEWTAVKAATCEEAGKEERVCRTCGAKEEREVAALGHEAGDWETVKEATCKEAGLRQKKCTRCHEVMEEEVLPKKEHSFGPEVVIVEPTFTEAGTAKVVCNDCGTELIVTIPALSESHEHSFSGDIHVVVEPDCEHKGSGTINCDEPECDAVKTVELAATGHEYGDWVVTKKATATEEGLKEKVCKKCDHKVTEVIERLAASTEENKNSSSAGTSTGSNSSKNTVNTAADLNYAVFGSMGIASFISMQLMRRRNKR